jgi:hypothetical protein
MSTNGVPLDRGETYYGTSGTIDTDNYGGVEFEGKEVEFLDTESSMMVRGRIMRNVSAATMYGGQSVVCASGYHKQRFDGKTRLTATRSDGIIDPLLATIGVRVGDLCIVFYQGPCDVILNENPGEVVTVGDYAVAATGATSGATTGAGKVLLQAGANTAPYAHRLGVFMEAATTAHGTAGTMRKVDLDIR